MIEEHHLRNLAGPVGDVPSLEHVLERGKTMRRRRRRLRAIGGVAVAALVSTAIVAQLGDKAPSVELAAPVDLPLDGGSGSDGIEGCGGYAEARDAEDAGVPRLMPSWLPPGEGVDNAWARAEITARMTCPPVPTALVALRYAASGEVIGGVRLEGPSPSPYRVYEGPDYEQTNVRGDGQAVLIRIPAVDANILQLQWTEVDGSSWSLTSYGLDRATVEATAAGLSLRRDGVAPVAALPTPVADLDIVWQLEHLPEEDLPAEEPWWHVVIDDGMTLSIDVSRPLVPTPAIAAAVGSNLQLVEVRGVQGIGVENGETASLIWDEAPDLRVQMSGTLDLETLIRIAASLEPVGPDDPRIVAL